MCSKKFFLENCDSKYLYAFLDILAKNSFNELNNIDDIDNQYKYKIIEIKNNYLEQYTIMEKKYKEKINDLENICQKQEEKIVKYETILKTEQIYPSKFHNSLADKIVYLNNVKNKFYKMIKNVHKILK